jgi:hypothetical protein
LEEVRREFSGLPVYVGMEEDYVKRTAPMDRKQFRRYLETCKRLSFRFDRRRERWVKPLEDRLGLFQQGGPVQLTASASVGRW